MQNTNINSSEVQSFQTVPLRDFSVLPDNQRFVLATADQISKNARERMHYKNLVHVFFVQAWAEWRLRLKKHVNFRKRQNEEACLAYCEMAIQEFEGINFRQQWSNWRTIPKNLNGRLPNRPLTAMDLCCGTGQSTEVLSCYLPKGSKILGVDYNPTFIERAQAKRYLHEDGTSCEVSFRAQSVLDPFKNANGELIDDGTIDLVNSCGAVGFHFDEDATRVLAAEVGRVVRRFGLATIDAGVSGMKKSALIQIFQNFGFEVVHSSRSCFFDPHQQICFQKV